MAKQNVRPCVVAGNWKMHKTIEDGVRFLDEFLPLIQGEGVQINLAVPFTAIHAMATRANGTPVIIGAQNMNDASEGAFTGEVAGLMLKEAGAQFVLLGHSERRYIFGEDNAFINRKVKRALADGLQPFVCVGETLEEREAGRMEEVLSQQISQSLEGLSANEMKKIVLAYEPVWAIGTGRTATPAEAEAAHAFCRQKIAEGWTQATADKMVILYGGSVKSDNVKSLMEQNDIDGVLVGGASLSPSTFAQIVNFQLATAKG